MLKTLLILGRVSNLPTVWTNCLCVWILVGGGDGYDFVALTVGMSLIYMGGMFLNDYCDADYDKRYRPERPIPSAGVTRLSVLKLATGLLLSGLFFIGLVNAKSLAFGTLLAVLIVIYNFRHKQNFFAPFIMGGCRSCVFLIVGATASNIGTPVLIAATIMFLYISGVSLVSKGERLSANPWIATASCFFPPFLLLLCIPILPPLTISFLAIAVIVSVAICFVLSLQSFREQPTTRVVGSLLAGIAILDLMIITRFGHFSMVTAIAFIICFVLAIFGQRIVPAT